VRAYVVGKPWAPRPAARRVDAADYRLVRTPDHGQRTAVQADMYSSMASVSPVSRMRENKEPTSGLEPLP
jgi:hypothetical protein